MTTESEFYQKLKRRTPKTQWQRLETSTASGVPDAIAMRPEGLAWVELKIWRKVDPLDDLRPAQYAQLLDWSRRGIQHLALCSYDEKFDRAFLWRIVFKPKELPNDRYLRLVSLNDCSLTDPISWDKMDDLILKLVSYGKTGSV